MKWLFPFLLAATLAAAPATRPASATLYGLGGAALRVPGAAGGSAWQLVAAGATVAAGTVSPDGSVELPAVRGRLRGTLRIDGRTVADVVLLPDVREKLAALAKRLDVVIVGPGVTPLDAVLPAARHVDSPLALQLSRPDAVFVAPGALDEIAPAERAILQTLADAGAAVLILPQGEADAPIAGPLTWREDPLPRRLLGVMRPADLQPAGPMHTLGPAGAGAIAVTAGEKPAAVVARHGNLVRWQLPLGEARLTYLAAAVLQEAVDRTQPEK